MSSDNVLWVGTDEGLFYSKDPLHGVTKFTDPGSSIDFSIIGGIEEDEQKRLWVSTGVGIFHIHSSNGQAILVGGNEGVDGVSLNRGPSYKDASGVLYFGDQTGYYALSPNNLSGNPNPPAIAIADFRLNGKPVPLGESGPLIQPLESMNTLSLAHDQNVFSFDFAALHYSNPGNNRLLYKLQGYDPEWREGGAERTAFYYNVPPGHYTLKIRAASGEGVWAEREVSIVIHPPWWQTWWAYSLYALLFIVGVYATHRYQQQRIIQRERERAKVRELAQAKEIEKAYAELKATQQQLIQAEKMASLGELTAGIAHEIQNPLNFVNNFSAVNSELVSELRQEARAGNIEEVISIADSIGDNETKISHHGKRADAIVKSMLQHSRGVTGDRQPTDINQLVEERLRLAYHGYQAKDQSFNADISTDYDSHVGQVNVVPQDIGRVLLNLFNNAFYAVNEKKKRLNSTFKPKVEVRTKKEGGHIVIAVKDNGIGMSPKVAEKVFQPFFTTKPTGEGTGLGLSLSYDVVTKGHGGELKVHSQEGEGAEFVLSLPA
jgi:signal transduction histidine kinase